MVCNADVGVTLIAGIFRHFSEGIDTIAVCTVRVQHAFDVIRGDKRGEFVGFCKVNIFVIVP